jgi:transposase
MRSIKIIGAGIPTKTGSMPPFANIWAYLSLILPNSLLQSCWLLLCCFQVSAKLTPSSQADSDLSWYRQKSKVGKQHLDEWQACGLTQVAYCRQHGLSRCQFQYWKKRFQESTSVPALIEVPFSSVMAGMPHQSLRLVVGDQYQIAVERDFDPVALRQLIDVLGRL